MIYFKPTWIIIDPICTFVFSVLVLFTTVRILKDTMNVLMEGIPSNINFNAVQETFLSVDGIVSVHNLRIWGITIDKTALSCHLAVRTCPVADPFWIPFTFELFSEPGQNAQAILKEASIRIRNKYDIYEMTLQVREHVSTFLKHSS